MPHPGSLILYLQEKEEEEERRGGGAVGGAAMPLHGSLVLYLQEKKRRGGRGCPRCPSRFSDFVHARKGWGGRGLRCPSHASLLQETNDDGGRDVLTFLVTWTEQNTRGLTGPPTFAIDRWKQINKSMKYFEKKTKESLPLWSFWHVLLHEQKKNRRGLAGPDLHFPLWGENKQTRAWRSLEKKKKKTYLLDGATMCCK
jgi:hypothetical protein